MDEMSAAIGEVQTKRLDSILNEREQVAMWYQKHFEGVEGIELPFIEPEVTRMSWFVYVIRVAPSIDRDRLALILEGSGIPVRPYFAPIHLQPYMVEMFGYQNGDYPVTEDLGNRSLALPFSGAMTEEEVVFVCQQIAESIIAAEKME